MTTLILCSTARLARSLREQHARQLAGQGRPWQPLSALTLTQWLDDALDTALLSGDIAVDSVPVGRLSPAQERLLWEQAIETTLKDLDTEPLFDKAGLASAAQEANRLLIEWNLSLDHDDLAEETRAFLRWRQRFQALCKQAGWLEPVRYMSWQIASLAQASAALPTCIALAGFDRISPLQQRLLDLLQQREVQISHYPLAYTTPQTATRVELADQDAECRAAVAWAAAQLDQDAERRIAIVVPELQVLRSKLAALLDEALQPEAVTASQAEVPRRYDFSLGAALGSLPLVTCALGLLRCALQRQPLPQHELSALLLSPYWSASVFEEDARAQLDAAMRAGLPLNLTATRVLSFVRHLQEKPAGISVPQLHEHLQALLTAAQSMPARQLPSAWAMTFERLLQLAHWPGERSLSSHEYQACLAFQRVLQQLAALDRLSGTMSAGEALTRLGRLCSEQIFQPEAEAVPRLQVLGMLEASAWPLDAMWVMGMNDHVWPPAPAPNPLLPASLQRQAATPNASSEVQVAFAEQIQQRLLHSASTVLFSSALKQGERLLRLSPLMQGIPLQPEAPAYFYTLAEQLAVDVPRQLESLTDAQAPAVADGQHLSGGTGLLRAQAICPAWAFYQYRLHARALKEPVQGLDAMERGTLVHAVLEQFWAAHQAHELQQLSEAGSLQQAVSLAAAAALAAFSAARPSALSDSFLQLEQQRLTRLVTAWLQDVELQRSPGFAVTALEKKDQILLEGITISLVVDRIDTLEDGRLVLMDYKTGQQLDFKNWAGARITEPQLPIYAAFVLQDSEIAAVCYARVRLDSNRFVGLAADADLLPGVAGLDDARIRKHFNPEQFPDWTSVRRHWRSSIEALAQQLKAGDAAVCFEQAKQLAYCEVLPLLRLPERQLQFERPELLASILAGGCHD
ncbi:PD-(D/E)XK nuclease family protein [Methylobacillus flagellatus]|uniref:PD-(D/E)XK nuclease family protein n=1 Tax=Methylobacillus flagellatus TaxID=405 RepID=UPI0010F662A4|nr:PD-(D/E)XK nuclease family protein [Methylobacillus flagellatus]